MGRPIDFFIALSLPILFGGCVTPESVRQTQVAASDLRPRAVESNATETFTCFKSAGDQLPSPTNLATASNGNLWFTEFGVNKVGRLSPDGNVKEFTFPAKGCAGFIATAPEGSAWFTVDSGFSLSTYQFEESHGLIGRIDASDKLWLFDLPSPYWLAASITAGPDHAMWFTMWTERKSAQGLTIPGSLANESDAIGRIDATGRLTVFTLSSPPSGPVSIIAGPDGNLWFVEMRGNRIARISTSGAITEFYSPDKVNVVDPTSGGQLEVRNPRILAAFGALWYTDQKIDRIAHVTLLGGVDAELSFPSFENKSFLTGMIFAPDGSLWISADSQKGSQIVRVEGKGSAGKLSRFELPGTYVQGIAPAKDGGVWFSRSWTASGARDFGRISPTGKLTAVAAVIRH